MIQAHSGERERAPRYEGSNWRGFVTSFIFLCSMKRGICLVEESSGSL